MQTLNVTRLRPTKDRHAHLSLSGGGDNLLAILVVANARRGSTVAATHTRSDTIKFLVSSSEVATYLVGRGGIFERWKQVSMYNQGSSEAHTPSKA